MTNNAHPEIPKLETLGKDLLKTSSFEKYLIVIRPFIALAVFVVAAYLEWWYALPFLIFLIFVSVVTATHDIVHNSIGLSRKQTEWLLFIMGSILLESGHAYRKTHHYHHRNFPAHDDLEGTPAHIGFWGSLLHGPVFIPRLWLWAFKNSEKGSAEKRWIIIEGLWPFAFVAISILVLPWTPAPLFYATMAIVGSWVYPMLNVYWLHKDFGDHSIHQSRTVRGWFISELFLGLTYHLEHHLYPQVPSHNLPQLAKRLDPFLEEQGVRIYHLF
ncbi:fatty acid desaturase [Candidatus Uabimicrobium sp. HlEnr_7]|uniref:fatty acid desaturase family protein n=1 Tax=Candidatus Uabimicrobium helgolandensis TaxID=3095367 RepID=UPI003558458E